MEGPGKVGGMRDVSTVGMHDGKGYMLFVVSYLGGKNGNEDHLLVLPQGPWSQRKMSWNVT